MRMTSHSTLNITIKVFISSTESGEGWSSRGQAEFPHRASQVGSPMPEGAAGAFSFLSTGGPAHREQLGSDHNGDTCGRSLKHRPQRRESVAPQVHFIWRLTSRQRSRSRLSALLKDTSSLSPRRRGDRPADPLIGRRSHRPLPPPSLQSAVNPPSVHRDQEIKRSRDHEIMRS
ncbi:hypothetical protein EYF80_040428 [Liparis tanakae]|uniref:Uncharacterized protein n=1 Tax=Liparis tanakae TaxID=230148 RepID=A0A4Z2G736_9TELE|nr:hypothetical protein EYF80_040428 [Liparis tanakae]